MQTNKNLLIFILMVGVPISNFLAESISLSASMSFFAVTTFLVMIATFFLVPSMPAEGQMSYDDQLRVLKKLCFGLPSLRLFF